MPVSAFPYRANEGAWRDRNNQAALIDALPGKLNWPSRAGPAAGRGSRPRRATAGQRGKAAGGKVAPVETEINGASTTTERRVAVKRSRKAG